METGKLALRELMRQLKAENEQLKMGPLYTALTAALVERDVLAARLQTATDLLADHRRVQKIKNGGEYVTAASNWNSERDAFLAASTTPEEKT